jgi:hypothetical protein
VIDATPLLRLYTRRRLAALAEQDAAAAQRAQLRALLRRAAETRFGRAHGFAVLRDVGDYQRAVPICRYEEFWRDWWQPAFPHVRNQTWPGRIPYFALSSGTTGANTKRIPVSRAMARANRRAALDVLCWHLAAHPESRVFAGRNFMLGGSTLLGRPAPGVAEGDLSGIAALTIPRWARARSWPPNDIALLGDWERKLALMAERTPRAEITSLSGTPSWVLLFLDMLADRHPGLPRRLSALFPNLELLVHGGVGFAPYADRYAAWMEGSRVRLREVYPASEGFVAVADRGSGEGLRLILDNGLFYEFVRPGELESANPDRRWIANAEVGIEYALLVSSNAGLWSYVLGDTVRLIARDPPRVLVTGRTAWTLSVFGEHLIGAELDDAVSHAARALGAQVSEYAAGAVFPDPQSGRGGHLFIMEYVGDADPRRMAELIDQRLCALNADYAAHRQGGFGMLAPAVQRSPPGSFTAWMRGRNRLGGQNKVPRVIDDPALLASLASYAR